MTLDQAFGIGNVSVSTVSGKTRVTFKKILFPLISNAEANPATGDIRKIAYGVMSKLADTIADIRSRDSTATSISVREIFENQYPPEDTKYTTQFAFDISPELDDVKDEP
ncbi:MAG: hypothetical protein EBU96_04400 [Actinobacteria bacterium]|nr:hypothetical protein [Actinomycetota bacterium]